MRTMLRGLVVLVVAASGLAAMGSQAAMASTGLPGHRCLAPVRATVHGRALRSSAPVGRTSACPATAERRLRGSLLLPGAQAASSAYNGGSPPLSLHGGSVMGTTTPGEVTITPIVWTPPSFTAPSASYVSHLAQFDDDLAAASDERDTVFSTLTEYTNAAGVHLVDRMHVAAPITSTDALASSGTISGETVVGCHQDAGTLTGAEGDQYAYRGCVTDVQIMAEVEAVRARLALPDDAGHLYPVFLPKGLESCFGAKNGAGGGDCSLNASSNASQYCAYHSSVAASGGAVYAVEPFPIRSVVGGSCDLGWVEAGAVQSPSGDVAFDSVASGYSHELAEAITDPFSGGWFDSTNNENGDECAYTVPGSLSGTAGAHYDQTINGHHYLLQAEFSNLAYAWNPQDGCQLSASTPAPQISALSAAEAQVADQVVVTGTALGGAPIVAVNGQPATIVSASDTSVAFTVPAGATTGPVTVQTIAGTATSTATLAIVVSAAPTFTSSATFGASVGQPMAATITTAGYPTPSIATTDPLPGGITLTDEGDGTARLSGTPSGAAVGSWPIVLRARSAAGSTTQGVTIVVHAGAAITSGSTAAFVAGASGSFAITTSGAPSANLSLSGSLPKGLTFSTTGGTGTISGTARKAQIGSSTVVVHASNGVGDPDAQVLTVVVGTLPKLSAAARVSVLRGGSLAVTVSAKGSPTPTITASGLEGWQRATGGLSGGLTISGAAPSGGPPRVITLTLSATNLLGTTTRTLLVRIR